MSRTALLDQIREYSQALVEDLPDVTTELVPSVVAGRALGPRSRNVWMAVAVGVATLLIIGLIPFLLGGDETPPAVTAPPVTIVDEVPATTIFEEAVPESSAPSTAVVETPWSIEDIPSDAVSGMFETPIGAVSWVSLPIDENTRPLVRCYVFDAEDGYGGCGTAQFTSWPSGFAAFQASVTGYPPPAMPDIPARFWISVDGLNWREEPLPSDPWARGQSLTFDNGVYWLLTEEPAGLWYTADGSTWQEIDPTGLAPPAASVGPTWGKSYTPPVSAGDLTLSYGEFHEGAFPDRFEQALYVIDDNAVTRTEVPWPAEDYAKRLFSTGDWIYAFTLELRSDDPTITVWRTSDGFSWDELGPPGFVETSGATGEWSFRYPTIDGRLVAYSHQSPSSPWETNDGLNWVSTDLPPLPSIDGERDMWRPVLLESGWFAKTGWLGSFRGGGIWLMEAGEEWFSLTEALQLSGDHLGVSGVGQTTFFISTGELWVMSLQPAEPSTGSQP